VNAALDFGTLSRTGKPLLLPGAHDALSARMIEDAGFAA
jgi:2-methylisocitrate lyase-like PEP mutase family enzyme